MRTNHLACLFVTIATLAISCEKEKTKPVKFTVTETEVVVPATSGTEKIIYTIENPINDQKVSAVCDADWLHDISVADGVVTFSTDQNLENERSTKVTLSYVELTQDVIVKQMAADQNIATEPGTLEFVATGEALKLKVISSRNWTLTGGADWITADITEGAPNAEVTFTAVATTVMTQRTAEFEFHLYDSQNVYRLIVSQQAGRAVDMLVDPNFKKYMLDNFDKDGDGDFSASELASAGKVVYSENGDEREGIVANGPVSSFAGIELFSGITEFKFDSPVYTYGGANRTECTFTDIDFRGNKALKKIEVSCLTLENIQIDNLSNLEEINVTSDTSLHVLNTSTCPALRIVRGWSSGVESVDFSNNTKLEEVTLFGTKVKNYDFSNNPDLISVYVGSEELNSVVFKDNTKIQSLSISNCKNVKSKPDFSNFPELTSCTLDYYAWPDFAVPASKKLRSLSFSNSDSLKSVDVHENIKLRSFNLFACSAISMITYFEGQPIKANTTNCNSPIKEIFVPRQAPSDIASDLLDVALKSYLIAIADSDKDGKISLAEAKAVREVDFSNKGVKNIEGLGWFSGLTSIVAANNSIEEFPLDFFTSLTNLDITNNKIVSLDLSVTSLETLKASGNHLSEVSGIPGRIRYVDVSHNKLKTINCEYKSYLTYIDASDNELENIKVHYSSLLEYLNISNNQIRDNGYEAAFRTWSLKNLKMFIANNYGSSMTVNTEQELKNLQNLEQVELRGTDAKYLNLTGSAKALKYLDVTGAKNLEKVYVGEGAVIEDANIKKEANTTILRAAYSTAR